VVGKLVASNCGIAGSAGKHGDPSSTEEKEEASGIGMQEMELEGDEELN